LTGQHQAYHLFIAFQNPGFFVVALAAIRISIAPGVPFAAFRAILMPFCVY
jgi:hypothetical protein